MKPFYGSPPKYASAPIDFNMDLQDQIETFEYQKDASTLR